MQTSLINITKILNTLNIRYCLIGGLAVAIHGIPRFTDDLDFLVGPEIRDVFKELENCINEKDGTINYIGAEQADPMGDVIQISLLDNHIDLITAKWPHEFAALTRAKSVSYQTITLSVVSPEDLILLKLKAGGPQDLYDVAGILQVGSAQLDQAYLKAGITTKSLKEKWHIVQKIVKEQG
jgi:predicted nucleotidyltransferase